MNNDWLSQLAQDHAPPPPGWWPPAPGWWLLALLLIVAVGAMVAWLRLPGRRQRRAALQEIKKLEALGGDDATLALQLEQLMRRYAVTRFGREAVAILTGTAWIDFVVTHGGNALAGEPGLDLLRLAYGGEAQAHRDRWLKGARAFVKRARKRR